MDECAFCKSYELHKFGNKFFEEKAFEHKITVALINGTYKKGKKQSVEEQRITATKAEDMN